MPAIGELRRAQCRGVVIYSVWPGWLKRVYEWSESRQGNWNRIRSTGFNFVAGAIEDAIEQRSKALSELITSVAVGSDFGAVLSALEALLASCEWAEHPANWRREMDLNFARLKSKLGVLRPSPNPIEPGRSRS